MHAILKDNQIYIYDSFIHKESIKEIPGRMWHSDEKAWSVPCTAENVETLDLLGCELSEELICIKQMVAKNEESSEPSIVLLMPIKVNPYVHQVKAYNFACRIMKLTGGKVDEC